MGRSLRVRAALAGTTAVVLGLALVGPALATKPGPSVTVVADGLNQPRGIAVTADGRIYVAETGDGAISVIKKGSVRTVIDGLPLVTSPEGESSGVHDVLVRGRRLTLSIGAGPRDEDSRFGTVRRVKRDGTRELGDIQEYRNENPEPACGTGNPVAWCDLDQPPFPNDSNAYGLAATWRGTLVADAGGNEVVLVKAGHKVVSVAKFPNQLVGTAHLPPDFGIPPDIQIPAEPVPTSVTIGPDGYLYVGELTGFPFTPGASRIWRIAPWARQVTCSAESPTPACAVYATGFTSIIDLDFGPDGALYVAEMVKTGVGSFFFGGQTTGALWRVKGGSRTEIAAGQLHLIGGVAATRKGIYVTTGSVTPNGAVIRIVP